MLALGRLDGVSTLLPDEALFLYAYVRKEAVLSSQIEGTQSSLSDLLLFELEEAPGVPLDDVREVSNYVAALHYGLRRLREEFPPFESPAPRDSWCAVVAAGGAVPKCPASSAVRRTGSAAAGRAMPPSCRRRTPPYPAAWRHWSVFLHAQDDGLSVLLRAGLAHMQFETIHPFLDGNGRVGRLLITLLLCQAGLLNQPLLYLSLYFKQHRGVYYDLLNHVRRTGDWEAWLAFFLEGVKLTAEGAVSTAQRLSRMFQEDRNCIQAAGGRGTGSMLRVHDALKSRPILSLPAARGHARLSFQTAASAMERLVTLGIARETTGKRRGRLFVYDQYLSILNEGTETP